MFHTVRLIYGCVNVNRPNLGTETPLPAFICLEI